ncbi:MAG: BamA/TamA family outer membrane protein [Pseudomonadota bacterium]
MQKTCRRRAYSIQRTAYIFSILFNFTLIFFAQNVFSIPTYKINAYLDSEHMQIHGKVDIEFINNVDRDSIKLGLFPNAFLKQSDQLNDINYEWIFPKDFNAGSISFEIDEILVNDKLEYSFAINKERPKNEIINDTVTEIKLGKIIQKDDKINLKLYFTTLIPHRFGTFGYYGKDINLNGYFFPFYIEELSDGAYSNLYPQRSIFNISLNTDEDLVGIANGIMCTKLRVKIFKFEAYYPSLVLSKDFYLTTYKSDYLDLIFLKPRENKKQIEYINDTLKKFNEFLSSYGMQIPRQQVIVSEIRLRHLLTMNSDDMLFLSDRAFQIFNFVRYFHEFGFINGLATQIFRQKLKGLLPGDENILVSEALGWYITDKYRAFRKVEFNEIENAKDLLLVKLFSFIPAVQEVIFTPQYPFSSVYFNKIYSDDYLKTDFSTYTRNIPSGRVIAEKLKDLIGNEEYDDLFRNFIIKMSNEFATKESFYKYSQDFTGIDLKWFYKQWLKPLSKINYALKDIKKTKLKNGLHKTKLTISKESKEDILEPVFIKLENSEDLYLKWDGKAQEDTLELTTEHKINLIEIDPEQRLNETTLKDNRDPSKYVLLVREINGSLDINSGEISALLDLQLRRIYDPKNRYNLYGYYYPAGTLISAGYGRQFGRLVDFLRMNHYAEISNNFLWLNPGFVDSDDTLVPSSGIANTIMLYYGFSSTLSYKNPQGGWALGSYFEYGSKYTLSDFEIYRVGLSGLKIIQIANEQLLVIRAKLSSAISDDLPEQKYFSIGGLSGVRGLDYSDAEAIGKNRILLSCEYRHRLISNLNLNFLNIFRLTKIQGAILFDSGKVNNTYQDLINTDNDPAYEHSQGFHELFYKDPINYSAGYSLRLFIDALGIRETLFRFDIAQRLDHITETAPRFYFALDQSF